MKMAFRQTGLCRLMLFALALCVAAGAFSAGLGESERTEEQIAEASAKAYDEAKREGEAEIAFTSVATLGQDLSDLMTYTWGEIPPAETDSANAAVQLVDEVIRRADVCFGSGAGAERSDAFDRAKETWKTAAAQFGAEGGKFEASLPLTDSRVIGPAADAFGRIPAEAQPVYLETAEYVYRALWQALRPAVAAKAGEAIGIPELAEFAASGEISELEDTAAEILADLQDLLSVLSGGIDGERSDERARIEQAGSRLNSLESEVKLVVNALGIDTVSRLTDGGEE